MTEEKTETSLPLSYVHEERKVLTYVCYKCKGGGHNATTLYALRAPVTGATLAYACKQHYVEAFKPPTEEKTDVPTTTPS